MLAALTGRLTLKAFEHDVIEMGAGVGMGVVTIFIVFLLTYLHRWKWIWREYITSLDPKRIGIMYFTVVVLMLFKGLVDAGMMRAQQALAVGESFGYLGSEHFQQIFTAHGATMIFFVGMGFVFGISNLVIPLQIGARDVAFPFLNAVSFWLFAVGAVLLNLSLVVGEFSGAGWVAYPPLSGIQYSPGEGVDYWIWSVQIAGVGSLLAGVNFLVTIFRMRCKGMTLMRMPIFCWSMLATMMLVVFAFPILTATVAMLTLDRVLGMHFFTPDFGGNPMMYINLIWAWGHPEVYILMLPGFGVFSEVVAVFSRKRLFGYVSMVWALIAITVLSFIVWLHHFFTMGAGPIVNAFFGVMTMLIAIPTGVKIFNWLFTMYQGRVRIVTPMMWFLGFVVIFSIGGMAGVLLSIAPADFQVHNSLFLIAHFHSMVIGGVLFAVFAAIAYWLPKAMGLMLDERWGKRAFWCWIIGFLFAFMPLYVLGFMGATRRLDHYELELGWHPWFVAAGAGFALITCGIACQIIQIWVSVRQRGGNLSDPWDGRTLEWSIPSPPRIYNFARAPVVDGRDPYWERKQAGIRETGPYEDIHIPKNSALGLYTGGCAFLVGFGMIWEMWWMAAIGFVGVVVCVFVRMCDEETEYVLTAAEVAAMEKMT